MKLFGVTGGIGMGKSTAGKLLEARGVRVIDTDEIARTVVARGEPALGEIKAAFGAEIISSTGELNRAKLAQEVFADPASLRILEAILHPRIRALWVAEVGRWREEGIAAGAVIIPLLFETNAESEFDSVICLACSSATQLSRLRARGWNDRQIARRIEAQWPIEKKIAAAHTVVWTDTTLPVHAAQLDCALGCY